MTRPVLLTLVALALVGVVALAAFGPFRAASASDGLAGDAVVTLPEIRGSEVAVLTMAPNVPPRRSRATTPRTSS